MCKLAPLGAYSLLFSIWWLEKRRIYFSEDFSGSISLSERAGFLNPLFYRNSVKRWKTFCTTSNQFGFSLCLVSDCNLYPIFFNSWACNSYCYLFRKEEEMSRAQETILTNICLVEDVSRGKLLMQYRSPERYRWSCFCK